MVTPERRRGSSARINVELTIFHIGQRAVPKARHTGPEGAHAHQQAAVQPLGHRGRLGAVVRQGGEVPTLRQIAYDGGQVAEQILPVRACHRGKGETAVAVQHRGQALGQLGSAVARGEQGAVAVAVDIDEAGGQIPAGGVDDMGGGSLGQLSHGGDGAAGERHIPGESRSAGAVQNTGISDETVVQKVHLFPSAASVAQRQRICKRAE